ncbi:acyl carrier protein [Nocardia iowensis]|uniref:Acyl carrier protein n=1 Tax=Nocardia iowensis TaxID=204891 RepID=A0ABX8RG92_NOCIO|nr:acyl carrier protein [Nocardia iowensis]QXN88615.1 acyl carrier protein [Nocardia iowensis]
MTSSIEEQIGRIIAGLAPKSDLPIEPNSRLVEDLGFNSLSLLELAIALEAEFSLPDLDPSAAAQIVTVADVVELTVGRLPAAESEPV